MGGNKIKISIAKPKKELKDKSKKKEMTAGETKEKTENKSQLRHDLVSGDWVVIAGSRNCRPFDPGKLKPAWTKEEIEKQSGSNCLFCDPEKTGQEKDVLIYKTSDDDWSLRIFPNKYPAFERPKGGPIAEYNEGPYYWMDSVGYHELIVTRDHNEDLSLMDPLKVAEVLDAYQTRYLDLMTKKSINYINIFHNHGPAAGSSIYHPHSQLAAIPVISPYIRLELDGAERYFRSKKNCVYCRGPRGTGGRHRGQAGARGRGPGRQAPVLAPRPDRRALRRRRRPHHRSVRLPAPRRHLGGPPGALRLRAAAPGGARAGPPATAARR